MKKPKRFNSVSVSLLVIALVLAYLAWAFVPIYWPIFQLQGIVRGACNEAYKKYDNDEVLRWLLTESRRTGLRLTKDNFRMHREPHTEEELTQMVQKAPSNRQSQLRDMFTRRGKTCVISYRYKDTYTLPLFGTEVPLTFENTVKGTLETVTY